MEISESKSLIQKEQINLKKNLLKDKNKIQELEYDELNNIQDEAWVAFKILKEEIENV